MRTIRPYELFAHLKGNREVIYHIPEVSGAESLTIFFLETLVLVAAARIAKVESVFEIGTSMGYNALQLAINLNARITTIDVERRERVFDQGEHSVDRNHITSFIADSRDLDPIPYDMVFIDGDHSYEAVKSDTELAFACTPALIGWHDYGGPDGDDVKRLLDEHPLSGEMIHIGDTKTALWFKDGLK